MAGAPNAALASGTSRTTTRSSSAAGTTAWSPRPTWPARARGPSSWRRGSKTGGAATTEAPWPDAPEFRVTRLSYVMSLLPPTIINDLQLARHGYKIFPMGPYYQAFPRAASIKLYADDAQRNHEEVSRWSKQRRRRHAALGRLAGRPGRRARPAAAHRAARTSAPASPATWRETLRLAWRHRGLDVRTIADVTRLMTMSIADLLDDWFESPAGQGRARGQRRDRHLGRPVRAGHRLRDGAPLDRRRRRRAPRQLGLPGGRHGRGRRRDRQRRPRERRRDPHRRAGRQDPALQAGRATRRRPRQRRASSRPRSSSPRCTRGPRSWTTSAGQNLPDDFVADIEHWKTRSGVVKINLALAELPDFTADPGTNLQEHHTGSVEMAPTMHYIERAFSDARNGRPAPRPFSDGVIPTAFDQTLCPEGTHIMSLFTQWVPADWSEEPHTESSRPTPTG